jgi:ATP synthase F1 delta subunit
MDILAKKYAKIIMSHLARDEEINLLKYLNWFKTALEINSNFKKFVFSPAVPTSKKINIFEKISSTFKYAIPDVGFNLIANLVKNSKVKLLNKIISEIENTLLKEDGFTRVKVKFANSPTEKQMADVEQILENNYKLKPSVYIEVDKSIVAGFISMFDGKMLDASLQNAFADLEDIRFE